MLRKGAAIPLFAAADVKSIAIHRLIDRKVGPDIIRYVRGVTRKSNGSLRNKAQPVKLRLKRKTCGCKTLRYIWYT